MPEQVRHLDEESPAIAPETRFELTIDWAESVAVHIVVVTNKEGRPRIWRPSKKKLRASA